MTIRTGSKLINEGYWKEQDKRANAPEVKAAVSNLMEAEMSELLKARYEIELLQHKLKVANQALAEEIHTSQTLRNQLAIVKADAANVWIWQGDGHDHPDNLTCPVVMEADTLRGFLVDQTSLVHARERIDELEDDNRLLQSDLRDAEHERDNALSDLEDAKAYIEDLEGHLDGQ